MPDAAPLTEGTKALTNGAKSVPPWVWIAAVGGGVVFAYVSSRKKGGTTNTDTTQPGALVYTGVGGNDGNTGGTDTTTSTGFQTNEAWAQAAKNYLISQGVDGKEASDAIDLYINAQALNNKQNAMISTVVRALGAPPQSLPPVTGQPTTDTGTGDLSDFATKHVNYQDVSSPTASHLAGGVYTVKQGDTIDSIARRAYNFSSNTAWSNLTFAMNEIVNANFQRIPDVKNLTPGTQLYIPLLASQDFPGNGDSVPLYGFRPGSTATEWEFSAGIVPQSAAKAR